MNQKRGLVATAQNKSQKAQQQKQNRQKVAQAVKQKFSARPTKNGGGGAGKLKISFNPQNLKKTTDKTVSAQIAGAMSRSGGFGGKNNNSNKSPAKNQKARVVKH